MILKGENGSRKGNRRWRKMKARNAGEHSVGKVEGRREGREVRIGQRTKGRDGKNR